MTYSITLNFFIRSPISEKLNDVKLDGYLTKDLRNTGLFHCTVKSIEFCREIPTKEKIREWGNSIKQILSQIEPFEISIKNLDQFPTAVYAGVQSLELINLHKNLCEIIPSSQIEFENQNYIPHISLALINEKVNILSNKEDFFGKFLVNEMQMIAWKIGDIGNYSTLYRFSI